MTDESYAATHRTCAACGQTGYVLPVGNTVISLPPDNGACGVPPASGHSWGDYNPPPDQRAQRDRNAAYTRSHLYIS